MFSLHLFSWESSEFAERWEVWHNLKHMCPWFLHVVLTDVKKGFLHWQPEGSSWHLVSRCTGSSDLRLSKVLNCGFIFCDMLCLLKTVMMMLCILPFTVFLTYYLNVQTHRKHLGKIGCNWYKYLHVRKLDILKRYRKNKISNTLKTTICKACPLVFCRSINKHMN